MNVLCVLLLLLLLEASDSVLGVLIVSRGLRTGSGREPLLYVVTTGVQTVGLLFLVLLLMTSIALWYSAILTGAFCSRTIGQVNRYCQHQCFYILAMPGADQHPLSLPYLLAVCTVFSASPLGRG